MKSKALSVIVGVIVLACGIKEQSNAIQFFGIYVREYSFQVTNPESGEVLGMRIVRDTIFIKPSNEQVEVSNNKWFMNQYDHEGWQSMEHADDRSMTTFQATFNSADGSLTSESNANLFLDLKRGELFKDKSRGKPYQKLGN